MVWLSSVCQSGECHVYFDIRETEIVYRDGVLSALVRGQVGDGVSENLAEVRIGTEDSAGIIPYWNENGQIECLADNIDDMLLESQLIEEAKRYLECSDFAASLQSVLGSKHTDAIEDERENDNRLAA